MSDIDKLTNKINQININIDSIVKIQSLWRGFSVRKKLKLFNDNFTINILKRFIKSYNDRVALIKEINTSLNGKKIRNENIPCEITENIVKFAILKKYKIAPKWNIKVGDLLLIEKIIEVKGFTSEAPSSFGPTEKWNWIYFVDCINIENYYFKIYEIKLSNNSIIWKNLKFNKTQTYEQQCNQKRRPRIKFSQLKKELNNYCKIIFDGNIDEL
jgi:hypothetical protein